MTIGLSWFRAKNSVELSNILRMKTGLPTFCILAQFDWRCGNAKVRQQKASRLVTTTLVLCLATVVWCAGAIMRLVNLVSMIQRTVSFLLLYILTQVVVRNVHVVIVCMLSLVFVRNVRGKNLEISESLGDSDKYCQSHCQNHWVILTNIVRITGCFWQYAH